MKLRSELGLTFDDVLLVPKFSTIRSRSAVDTCSSLVPGFRLAIPIISANMDTVTESAMAIAMAQLGGIGMIHRFMTIEHQVETVMKVKRAESFVVENPITIHPQATISDARRLMRDAEIGGVMVTDEENHLMGILTSRDVLLAPDESETVAGVMTPRERVVVAPAEEPFQAARLALHKHRIEKLPLVDAEDHIVGLITAQDIIKIQDHPQATKDAKGRLRVGAAVGTRTPDIDRAEACVNAGVDVLLIDIAHGHSEHVFNMAKYLKEKYPNIPLIAGNVATPEGVRYLANAGVDAVKVGVGSGSICTTRIITGFGVPQFTAILECAKAGKELGIPIIADGGVRSSGDLTKALAAGASTVMLGSYLAGTEESPGPSVIREGRRYKVVRGMASLTANIARKEIEQQGEVDPDEWESVVPEGVEALVPYRGSVIDILYQLVGGLRSGMSYAGASTIEKLSQNAEFVRITPAGQRESNPHDVDLI